MEGLIFDIQRCSVHDGPGIRTTVFFKGCNLRCLWCHNPESLRPYPEVEEYRDKCIGCGRCLEGCPVRAIHAGCGEKLYDREACIHCGKCTDECFAGSRVLAGKTMSVEEVLSAVCLDRSFYKNSGGGVTFSGGEPLLQTDFLKVLLAECKKSGLHTAVDTAGHVPWTSFAEILPFTDLVLYDLKAMEDDIHRKATGMGNERILENLTKLADGQVDIILRIPVIPGINASLDNMEQSASFLEGLKGIRQVELLSFHLLGEGKYASLGLEYPARDFVMPERKDVERLSEPFIRRGIPVLVF